MASQKEKDALPPGTGRQPFDPNTHAIPADSGQFCGLDQGSRARLRRCPGVPLESGTPGYPFAIDCELAAKGERVFTRSCSRCHGTYGPAGRYPNKLISLGVIGTDPTLAHASAPDGVAHYLESWFAREHGPDGQPYHGLGGGGYQEPPLDGVWATAPYLDNGSVPTVYDVLKSGSRPRLFTRSFRGDLDEYRHAASRTQVPGPDVGGRSCSISNRPPQLTTRQSQGAAMGAISSAIY